jgi:hypothetical protein
MQEEHAPSMDARVCATSLAKKQKYLQTISNNSLLHTRASRMPLQPEKPDERREKFSHGPLNIPLPSPLLEKFHISFAIFPQKKLPVLIKSPTKH